MGASSMYAVGRTSKDKPWKIGIRHPRNESPDTYLGIVTIENQALGTSGDYERYFIQNGIRYHHIFDPRTGRPSRSGVMSDSVCRPARAAMSDSVVTSKCWTGMLFNMLRRP